MSVNTFIVSDESLNSYGYVIRTNGINTAKFAKNPIMFYMHERDSGIIGRWDNIRIEGGKLLADAVFDESDPIGKRVKERVEGGFLRSASIGIENVVKSSLNGIETVIECELKEISIVDIPANSNAVKLYKKGGKCVYTLRDLDPSEPNALRGQISALLSLENTVTDTEILEAIKSLLKSAENADTDADVDDAIQCGYIEESQRTSFRAMASANRQAFTDFIGLKQKEQAPEIERIINDAAGKGKFIFQDRGVFENIGNRLGAKFLNRLTNALPGAIKPTDIIHAAGSRADWGLNEYRKFAPQELKDNPALYARLIEKEGGNPAENTHSLDYYRRHNPEYLKNNPEVYRHLLEKETANN